MSEESGRSRYRRRLLNVRSPFFLPVWRRVVTLCVCLAWVVVEFLAGNVFWGILACGISAYLAYEFFVAFDPKNFAPDEDQT